MHSLSSLHTFGLSTFSNNIFHINHVDDIENVRKLAQEGDVWLLGEGSNCIFLNDYHGSICKIGLQGIEVEEQADSYVVSANAAENWHSLVNYCVDNQIYGFENLALIPGSVGAAPIQNIGAYGVEINRFIDCVEFVELSSGQTHSLNKEECQFGYRDSIFKKELFGKVVITKVVFNLPKAWQPVTHYGELAKLDTPSAKNIFNEVVRIRQAKLPDPKILGNAGSFFKNPLVSKKHYAALKCEWDDLPCYAVDQNSVKLPAAWLIDNLGFKGKKVGGIQCHPTQALVLTNDGTGTGEQLLTLAREIQQKVNSTFSIKLENEVRLIGKKGLIEL